MRNMHGARTESLSQLSWDFNVFVNRKLSCQDECLQPHLVNNWILTSRVSREGLLVNRTPAVT